MIELFRCRNPRLLQFLFLCLSVYLLICLSLSIISVWLASCLSISVYPSQSGWLAVYPSQSGWLAVYLSQSDVLVPCSRRMACGNSSLALLPNRQQRRQRLRARGALAGRLLRSRFGSLAAPLCRSRWSPRRSGRPRAGTARTRGAINDFIGPRTRFVAHRQASHAAVC